MARVEPDISKNYLRFLEEKKILTRTVYPTIPPAREYQLTKLGFRLEPVLLAMANFGEELRQQIPTIN